VWSGNRAERAYRQLVGRLSAPGIATAVNTRYDRGLLSSDAVTVLQVDGQWLRRLTGHRYPGGPLHLVLRQHIQHGPLLVGHSRGLGFGVALISTRLDMSDTTLPALGSLFSGHIALTAETRVRFTGDVDSAFQIPRSALTLTGTDNQGAGAPPRVSWDAITGGIHAARGRNRYVFAVDGGGLAYRVGRTRLRALTFSLGLDLGRHGQAGWQGRDHLSLQGVLLKTVGSSGTRRRVTAESIQLDGRARPSGQSLATDWRGRVRGLRLADMPLSVDLRGTLAPLDLASVAGRPPQKPLAPASRTGGADRAARAPTLTIQQLRIRSGHGQLEGAASVRYSESVPAPGLLARLAGHGQVTISEGLLRQALLVRARRHIAMKAATDPDADRDPDHLTAQAGRVAQGQIADLDRKGVIRREHNRYLARLTLRRGQVRISTRPLEQLLAALDASAAR